MAERRTRAVFARGSTVAAALCALVGCSTPADSSGDGPDTDAAATSDSNVGPDGSAPDVRNHSDSEGSNDVNAGPDATLSADALLADTAASDVGGTPVDSSAADGGASCGTVIAQVYITWYGFPDNSCQVETQYNCNTIAYPHSCFPQDPHNIATEGTGAYDDPITFATAALDPNGTPNEFPQGAIIYVPLVRKYFVMEDQCAECGYEWFANQTRPGGEPAQPSGWTAMTDYHTDLWMGPSYQPTSATAAAIQGCEDSLTQGNPYAGTGSIIVNPPNDLPVDTTPLFDGASNGCTTHVYDPNTLPAQCQ